MQEGLLDDEGEDGEGRGGERGKEGEGSYCDQCFLKSHWIGTGNISSSTRCEACMRLAMGGVWV
jgi:hypothetical protein